MQSDTAFANQEGSHPTSFSCRPFSEKESQCSIWNLIKDQQDYPF